MYFCVISRDSVEDIEEYNKDISVAGYTEENLIHCYDIF